MAKPWIDKAYIAFLVLAVCSHAVVLAGFLNEFLIGSWPDALMAVVMLGSLSFLTVLFTAASWGHHLPAGLSLWFQIALSLMVLTLLVWGLRRGWRTKVSIAALLVMPGVVFYLLDFLPAV